MRRNHDPFPETPVGFHLRVEETLMGLEENEVKYVRKYSFKVLAVAAAIVMLLAATAVALVQGNALKMKMGASGGEELTALVQDVHVSDGNGGFSFAIDEILWQGEDMYVSYTASVPDDGNVYLFSPYEVRLDGKSIEHNGLDAEFFTSLYALGGEYGCSVSKIMKMQVEAYKATGRLDCKCIFMQSQKPLEKLEGEAYDALFTEPDAHGHANQLMKDADVLYYTDTTDEGDAVPVVYLHPYPAVRSIIEADENNKLTPEDIEGTGIARTVAIQELSIDVQESEGEAPVYNDVVQHKFDMGEYSIEITKLHLSHFRAEFEALIRKANGEIREWDESEAYGQFYALCNADGGAFGEDYGWSIGSGEVTLLENGEKAYRIEGYSEGIYPLGNLTEIYLAPDIYDENGEYVARDMQRAIRLIPIYNPELPASTMQPESDPAETDDLSS